MAILLTYLVKFDQVTLTNMKMRLKNGSKVKKIKSDVITTPLSIVSTILQYAQKDDADLMFIRTRGITEFKKMLVGNVASGIVTYSHCPALVIR